MANPNIVNVTSIYGKTTGGLATTVGSSLSPAAANEVAKVNTLYVANVGASAQTIDVMIIESINGVDSQYQIAYGISVPANSTLTVIDKNSAVYVDENQTLNLLSSDDTSLQYTVSYEVIA
jgi:hypothetical protein